MKLPGNAYVVFALVVGVYQSPYVSHGYIKYFNAQVYGLKRAKITFGMSFRF